MRLFKIFTICLLAQGLLFAGPVQVKGGSAVFLYETMSPSVCIQDKDLQNAFILKLENDILFSALQENDWSAITAKAMDLFSSKTKRKASPEQIAKKKKENLRILKELIENKWSIEKTKAALGIGRKKIIRAVGKELIEQGRRQQRQKEIDLEKEMIICALEAYRWNVTRASEETGIWKKRIYELISSDVIKRNRAIAEQQLKDLMCKVLEENEWTVTRALKDRRLVEEEVGRHTLYSMLTPEWIEAQRNAYLHKINTAQKQELIAAINMFIESRNCLKEVGAYLGLARGTLNDRLRKHNILINDIRYSKEKVLPVLAETGANLTRAAGILGLDRQVISRRFAAQIALLKDSRSQIGWMLDRFEMFDNCIEDIKNKMPAIGYDHKDEDEFFYTVTKFKIYRCLKIIEKMQAKADSFSFPVELLDRIALYEKFFNKIYNVLDLKGESLKALFASLRILKLEIGSIDDKRSKFYSFDELLLMQGNSLIETADSDRYINRSI